MSLLSHWVPALKGREMSRSCTGPRDLSLAHSSRDIDRRRGFAFVFTLATAAVVVAPLLGNAQTCTNSPEFQASNSSWSPPLDRHVSLHARDISVRDALDRISIQSGIRLSYTTEMVPLDSRICASFDSIPLGSALGVLLRGTSVLPTAAGGNHVVLAPTQTAGAGNAHDAAPKILDRAGITGGPIETPAPRLSVAMNVFSRSELARYAEGNLDQALADGAPGLGICQR